MAAPTVVLLQPDLARCLLELVVDLSPAAIREGVYEQATRNLLQRLLRLGGTDHRVGDGLRYQDEDDWQDALEAARAEHARVELDAGDRRAHAMPVRAVALLLRGLWGDGG